MAEHAGIDANVVWLTGLSAAGKSTIADGLRAALAARGRPVAVLDGDVLREGLCVDLGFSEADRSENVRRAGHVARLLADAGVSVIVALITPARRDRAAAREIVGHDRFTEVFVDAPIEVCIRRDPKGLYARALSGKIETFTGISAPYEPPQSPDVHIRTDQSTSQQAVDRIEEFLSASRNRSGRVALR